VASLRLVSPGAATDGVTYFFPQKNDLFSHRPLQSGDLFSCCLLTTPISLPPSNVVYPVFFLSKFSQKKITPPLDGVTRSGLLPPLTPLLDSVSTSRPSQLDSWGNFIGYQCKAYRLSISVYNMLNGPTLQYVAGNCQIITINHILHSAMCTMREVARTHTALGDRSFTVAGPHLRVTTYLSI